MQHAFLKGRERGSDLQTNRINKENKTEIQALLANNEFAALMDFLKKNQIDHFLTAGNVSEVYGKWNSSKKSRKPQDIENQPEVDQ